MKSGLLSRVRIKSFFRFGCSLTANILMLAFSISACSHESWALNWSYSAEDYVYGQVTGHNNGLLYRCAFISVGVEAINYQCPGYPESYPADLCDLADIYLKQELRDFRHWCGARERLVHFHEEGERAFNRVSCAEDGFPESQYDMICNARVTVHICCASGAEITE